MLKKRGKKVVNTNQSSLLNYPGYQKVYKEAIRELEFLTKYQKYQPLPPGFEKRRDHYLRQRIMRSGSNQKRRKKSLTMMKKLGQKYG